MSEYNSPTEEIKPMTLKSLIGPKIFIPVVIKLIFSSVQHLTRPSMKQLMKRSVPLSMRLNTSKYLTNQPAAIKNSKLQLKFLIF